MNQESQNTPPGGALPAREAEPLAAATMEWVGRLSILGNRAVMRQLILVCVIPLLLLGLLMTILTRPSNPAEWGAVGKVVLLTAAILLGLMAIAVLAIYGGGYEYRFRLDAEGIRCRPHGRTASKNRVINALLRLSGNPTAVGAGMLAEARQQEYVAWREIDTVIADDRRRTLTLQRGRRPLMVVPCDEASYAAVRAIAEQSTARSAR